MDNFQKVSRFYYSKFHFENWGQEIWSVYACTPMTYFLYKCHTWRKFHKQQCSNLNAVFTLNSLPYKPTGPESSNIYRPTINSTGPNLKTTLMITNSNHQNSKHDDVPNIMWTCQLCIREDQNASKKKTNWSYVKTMSCVILELRSTSREYNSAKEICKYPSFSKVGGNYPLDLKIIWSSVLRMLLTIWF
jgi:hypothetical protein